MINILIVRNLGRFALSCVFSNLLANVMKYSGGGLQVTLEESKEVTFANQAPRTDEIQVGKKATQLIKRSVAFFTALCYKPKIPFLNSLSYCKRERTPWLDWFACASIAWPACARIWFLL